MRTIARILMTCVLLACYLSAAEAKSLHVCQGETGVEQTEALADLVILMRTDDENRQGRQEASVAHSNHCETGCAILSIHNPLLRWVSTASNAMPLVSVGDGFLPATLDRPPKYLLS